MNPKPSPANLRLWNLDLTVKQYLEIEKAARCHAVPHGATWCRMVPDGARWCHLHGYRNGGTHQTFDDPPVKRPAQGLTNLASLFGGHASMAGHPTMEIHQRLVVPCVSTTC